MMTSDETMVEAPGIALLCNRARVADGRAITQKSMTKHWPEPKDQAGVEAPGIEPGSENALLSASTCVADLLDRPGSRQSAGSHQGYCPVAPHDSPGHPMSHQPDLITPFPRCRLASGLDGYRGFLGRESDCVIVRN